MTQFVTSHQESHAAGRGRGPSLATLWSDCPREEIMQDINAGWYSRDDFTGDPTLTNRYTATPATAGTFLIIDEAGGVADADCNSTTVTQGITVQHGTGVGELFAANSADTKIWLEARVKATDIATGPEFYLGLHIIDTTLLASSAMVAADSDWIGFKSLTDDGVILGTTSNNVTESTATGIHTFVDGEYVKLGYKVSKVASDFTGLVEFYVDGVLKSNTITTLIPTALMAFSLVCQSDGTTDSIISIDWWECFCEDRTFAVTD